MHTSGLPREAGTAYWNDFRFPTQDELVQRLKSQQVVYSTYHRDKYSNLAFAIAEKIVEQVSGQTYSDYMQTCRHADMEHDRCIESKQEKGPARDAPGFLFTGMGGGNAFIQVVVYGADVPSRRHCRHRHRRLDHLDRRRHHHRLDRLDPHLRIG